MMGRSSLGRTGRSLQATQNDGAFAMTVVGFSQTVTDVVRQRLAVTGKS